MRKITVGVVSILCLCLGLAATAVPVAAQSPSLRPGVSLTPATLFFSVSAGKTATAPVVLSNQSGIALNVSKIEINNVCSSTNCGEAQFHVVSHGCGATLKSGQSCSINVEFAPAALLETVHARLKVVFDGVSVSETRTAALTGESVSPSIN